MRARVAVQFLSLAVIVTVGAGWMKSRDTAVDLQAHLAALTAQRDASRALVHERNRLRSELAEATLRRQADAVATSPAAAVSSSMPPGEWRSSREWRNEGQSTPCGTVATLLWAAAGGDVALMVSTLTFDEAGRKQAQAVFNTLPPSALQLFPTPEAMVASLLMLTMPNNASAQLSSFHQRDAEHATVGLILGAPGATRLTLLSLQFSPRGWRVVVPAGAIERLGRGVQPVAQ